MRKRKELRLDRAPTLKEYEEIVKRLRIEASRNPRIEKVLPLTVAITGGRISEILKLTTLDVNERDCVLYIPTEKHKGHPKRVVPVPSWYFPILNSYIIMNGIGLRLFPISRTQAWRIVKKETGYTPHGFRHAFGMYLLYRGFDPETVKRILGHSSWKVVADYVQRVKIDLKQKSPLETLF